MTVSVVQAQDVVWRVDEGAAPISFTLETSVLPYFPWLRVRERLHVAAEFYGAIAQREEHDRLGRAGDVVWESMRLR